MRGAAVVFVHGLFSSPSTWSSIVARIAEDVLLDREFDVFCMEYDSPKVELNPLQAIPGYNVIADSLKTYLEVDVAGYEKVVLVSHSQGGLIVQRYLARMANAGLALELTRIKTIVMLACPNSGSDFARLLRRGAIFWRHPQESELRPINEYVTEAQKTVRDRIQDAPRIDAYNCPIPIYSYAGTSDKVVTPTSARAAFRKGGALPGNHSSILHADSAESRTFKTLKHHLLAALAVPGHVDTPMTEPTKPMPCEPSRGSTAPVESAPESGPPAAAMVRHNVTPPAGAFFDREVESQRALDGLAAPNRVVSISGLGGMGKTALANRIAWQLTGTVPATTPGFDTIIWCDPTSGALTLDSLIDAISRVMDYPYLRALSMPEKATRALEHLNSGSCLVVLDNFDNVRDQAIREFLSKIDPAKSKVLITSRSRYSPDAWEVDVGGLDEVAREDLIMAESRRLGIPGVVVGDSALRREYLDATGGNPLAIRLTAGQMRYGGDDLRSMTVRLREATESDLFDAIYDRSWNEILTANDDARTLVTAVALHPTTASRAAVEYVLLPHGGDPRRVIREVVESLLVEISDIGPDRAARLRLHPLTRAYVLRQLDSAPDRKAHIEKRLIDYYRSFVSEHSGLYTAPELVGVLDTERENILAFARTAFEQATEHADYLTVIEFAESTAGYLWGRGYWRDRIMLCENAVRAAVLADEAVSRARQFALIGRVYVWLGQYADAERCAEQSEAALPVDASDEDRRETFRLRGHIASCTGEYGTARALFHRILDVAPLTADDEGRAATLVELGVCAMREGEIATARERFEEALRLDDEMGAVEGASVSLSHLANTFYESGDNRRARPLFERGLRLADQVGRLSSQGRCDLGLAKIDVLDREYASARAHAVAASETFARLGVREMVAEAQLLLDNLPDAQSSEQAPNIARLLERCRAIVLDFDDTIAATATARWAVLRRTAATFGVDLAVETIRSAWGLPFDALIASIVPTLDAASYKTAYRRAMDDEKPIPAPGAKPCVEELHRRGIERVIVGSGSHDLIVQDLVALGLDRFFDEAEIYGSEQSEVHKPDPQVLRDPLRGLTERGIDRRSIVCVGDSVRDFRMAEGNNLAFIAVLTGLESRDDFLNAGLSNRLIAANLGQLRLWL
ncbi:alpha/beta fold hydrolase [Nocardia sp. NPDC046473]|uniref:alpha/beta fold hydrolase n=1 Tax=Nocardia sp. NPDC046473 TaxID=3155733 RepID=UPI0033CBAFAB